MMTAEMLTVKFGLSGLLYQIGMISFLPQSRVSRWGQWDSAGAHSAAAWSQASCVWSDPLTRWGWAAGLTPAGAAVPAFRRTENVDMSQKASGPTDGGQCSVCVGHLTWSYCSTSPAPGKRDWAERWAVVSDLRSSATLQKVLKTVYD